MEIHPIKTESDYQTALSEIERLWNAAPDTPEGDRLDVLTTLVEACEAVHEPIPLPAPIEAILYHLESRGLTVQDLERCLGSPTQVEDILSRRCPLSLEMIRKLIAGLGISAEILIQPYHLVQSAA